MRYINNWNHRMEDALPCPFCGNKNINVQHKKVNFFTKSTKNAIERVIAYCKGESLEMWVKISAYCYCTKCRSRSKPVTYETKREGNVYSHDDEALKHWNERS